MGSMLHGGHGLQGSNVPDLSNDSSPVHGYHDFPSSPDSWLGDSSSATGGGGGGGGGTNPNSSTTVGHY